MDGNDTLIGGLGADKLIGGAGSDWASYAGAAAAVRVDLATGKGVRGDAQGDTYTGIENVRGGNGDDLLRGDALANTLEGGLGDDMLYGQDGNDTLIGGAGADHLFGSGGSDTASYRGSAGAVTVNLARRPPRAVTRPAIPSAASRTRGAASATTAPRQQRRKQAVRRCGRTIMSTAAPATIGWKAAPEATP